MACKGGTLKSGTDNYYPNAYYKVGDLFLTTRNENPSLRFGGTWELFGKGKTLVCVDENDNDFKTVKQTGGEKNHTLTINEMPSHDHTLFGNTNTFESAGSGYYHYQSAIEGYAGGDRVDIFLNSSRTNEKGSNQSHNNMPPYITCYIWIRIK